MHKIKKLQIINQNCDGIIIDKKYQFALGDTKQYKFTFDRKNKRIILEPYFEEENAQKTVK